MKIPTEQKNYFIGKICTIFTVPFNRDFQQENPQRYPEQVYKYFVGVVEYIDDHGLMLQQSTTGLKSWISLNHIVAIAEEEADETAYWLEMIVEGELIPSKRVESLLGEANELTAILAASAKTARANRKSKIANRK